MSKDTWYIDWNTKRINRLATEYEELAQTIQRALMTDRFYHNIYTWQYGSELQSLVGTKNIKYMEGAVRKNIIDALKFEERVLNINNVSINRKDVNNYSIDVEISTTLGIIRKEFSYNV